LIGYSNFSPGALDRVIEFGKRGSFFMQVLLKIMNPPTKTRDIPIKVVKCGLLFKKMISKRTANRT
jgi:hypothetical protein